MVVPFAGSMHPPKPDLLSSHMQPSRNVPRSQPHGWMDVLRPQPHAGNHHSVAQPVLTLQFPPTAHLLKHWHVDPTTTRSSTWWMAVDVVPAGSNAAKQDRRYPQLAGPELQRRERRNRPADLPP